MILCLLPTIQVFKLLRTVRRPPNQPLTTNSPIPQQLQRIRRPLQCRSSLNNPKIVRLDHSVRQQLRHNLRLQLLFKELVLDC